MIIKNRSTLEQKGLLPYLFLSLLIHAGIFTGLYHFDMLTPTEEPIDLIPVEIIAHDESPTYAQVELTIQPRITRKKSFKIKRLTLSQKETSKFSDISPVPVGENTRLEPNLPAIPGEPVFHHSVRKRSKENPIKSTAIITAPRSHTRHFPVLQSVPDQASPLGVEMPDDMVATSVDRLPPIDQKINRVEAIPHRRIADAEHISGSHIVPADSKPYFSEERKMVIAEASDFPLRPGRQTTPKRPEVISLATLGQKTVEDQVDSPQILTLNTELSALDVNYLPSFPLPGSPKGAIFLLAIDTSGSVKGAPLKGIKKSVYDFVNLMGPNDLARIITFDNRVKKTGPFTADKEILHKEIDALRPAGSLTVLHDALLVAYEMIQKTDSKNRFIVLFSDGKDEGSQAPLEKALSPLRRSDIPILAVGYTRVEKKYLEILSTMARETGGIFVHTPQFRDMISLYRLSRLADGKPPMMESAKKVSLKLNSQPSGAQVFVNGEFRGETPLILPLPTGKYEVLLSKPAYYDWEALITLNKARQTIDVRLLPISSEVSLSEIAHKKPTEKVSLVSLTEQLKALKKGQDAKFIRLWTKKNVYKIGDSIGYHFQSSRDCHLIVILFSSSGEIIQVFPNRYHPDSFISTGNTYNIPSPGSDIKLEVTGPPGIEELFAIISDAPLKVFPFNTEDMPFFVVDETDLSLLKRIHDNLQLAKNKEFKHKSAQYAIEK